MTRPRLAALCAAALALAAAGTAGAATPALAQATPAAAAPINGASGSDLAARASGIADEVVQRWASAQTADGRFPDPIDGAGGDYGSAMLGYAMLRRGEDRADRALIRGGLAALVAQAQTPAGGAFEPLVLARAYRWASGTLPADPYAAPLWAQAAPVIAAHLAGLGPIGEGTVAARCFADARCYNNLKLVSSLASVEMQGTGIAAAGPGSVLADVGLRGRVLHRIGSRVPREVGQDVSRIGAAPLAAGGLLSDPPRNPLAYHALSTMLLGQLIDEFGPAAPPKAHEAFERAARALLVLAAPDGDLSWYGRGQGQVWVPAVVADAAAQAAQATTSPVLRGRYLALAEASLTRLRTVYGVGPLGLPLVPGAIDAAALAQRHVDPYASTRSYNGLAVDSLDRAAATLRAIAGGATATRVPSTRSGVVRSPLQAGLATITRGPLWIALGARTWAPDDNRYGSGMLALQHRDAAGRWSSIAPGRPYGPRLVNTLAVDDHGRALVPSSAIHQATGRSVTMTGNWSRPGVPSSAIDPGTAWTWSLVDGHTAEVRFTMRSTREVIGSGLIGDGAQMHPVPFGFVVARPDGSSLQYTLGVDERRLPLRVERRAVGGSAFDAHLAVGQASALVRRGEHVVLKIRVIASAPPPAGG